MLLLNLPTRAQLASIVSGREGAKLIGTDSKTNLGSSTTVEDCLTYLATFLGSVVSATEFGYLDGVTSAIQTQLDSKAAAFTNQSANVILAGPGSGGAAAPGFRALVIADLPTGISAANIADGSVSDAEFQYLNGVTSAIQTQLDAKAAAFTNQSANVVFAGPTSGGAAAPGFRALVAGDIPSLDAAKVTSGVFDIGRLATGTPTGSKFVRDDGVLAVPSAVPTAPTIYTETDGATITFDLANSVSQVVVLGGNRTLAVSNDTGNVVFNIQLKQDGTGSRTVTWFSGITWAGGSAPTLTTDPNKTDWFGFRRTGSGAYHGVVIAANL